MNKQYLRIQEVRQLRKELEASGMTYGFTHARTLQISQQLDQLISRDAKEQAKAMGRGDQASFRNS